MPNGTVSFFRASEFCDFRTLGSRLLVFRSGFLPANSNDSSHMSLKTNFLDVEYAQRFRTGRDFATLRVPSSCAWLLDMDSSKCKKAFKELELCICGVIKLNNCVNSDHLSREKEPLVRMSVICLLLLTYLIGILSPSLFCQTSNHDQPCGSWKCVALLLVASLSSKMKRDARWLEM